MAGGVCRLAGVTLSPETSGRSPRSGSEHPPTTQVSRASGERIRPALTGEAAQGWIEVPLQSAPTTPDRRRRS